jgi:predicted 2-oxoglutarate/Fe(II)-dependent dioxygenase YbiX
MNLYSLICVEADFIPENIIKHLLTFSNQKTLDATIKQGDNFLVNDYRSAKWITLPNEILDNLMHTVYNVHEQKFSTLYKSTLKNIETPQFLKYEIGDKYGDHNDSEDWANNGQLARVMARDITVLLYLNEDFEGGELEFTRLGITIKPKKGMMIAFPSYIEFSHRVHPLTSGTRYTLATWIETENRIISRPYDEPKFKSGTIK